MTDLGLSSATYASISPYSASSSYPYLMALSHESGEVSLWDLDRIAKGHLDGPFNVFRSLHNDVCRSVDFGECDYSSGRCFLSSASFDGTAKVWRMKLGESRSGKCKVDLSNKVEILQTLGNLKASQKHQIYYLFQFLAFSENFQLILHRRPFRPSRLLQMAPNSPNPGDDFS